MSCTGEILKAITSNCENQPLGGMEAVVYLFSRTNIGTITYDTTYPTLVEDLTLTGTKLAYKLTGIKKNLNAGSERVVSEDMADGFKHKLLFAAFESDSASNENLDKMNDIVAIIEKKDKGTADGTFVMYGLKTGLYFTSDAGMVNESNGMRKIEMATMDGQLEKNYQNNFLKTNYATTKALLDALCS